MFQAKLGGWKRLAASLVLLPGLTAVGVEMLSLIGAARAQQRAGDVSTTGAKPTAGPRRTNEDPRLLVKRAREAFDKGRYETAYDLARQAEANSPGVEWRLFDDTPDAVLKDVQKALSRQAKVKAERMVGQARALFERNTSTTEVRALNLDKARSLCVDAMQLHGPYNMWHFGDRPDELIKDIDAARAKLGVPARTDVARKSGPNGDSVASTGNPARRTPQMDYYNLPPAKKEVVASTPPPKLDYYQPPSGWDTTEKSGANVAQNRRPTGVPAPDPLQKHGPVPIDTGIAPSAAIDPPPLPDPPLPGDELPLGPNGLSGGTIVSRPGNRMKDGPKNALVPVPVLPPAPSTGPTLAGNGTPAMTPGMPGLDANPSVPRPDAPPKVFDNPTNNVAGNPQAGPALLPNDADMPHVSPPPKMQDLVQQAPEMPQPLIPVPDAASAKDATAAKMAMKEIDSQKRAHAIELMQQASAQMKAERFVAARKRLEEAQALNAPFGIDDETPERMIQMLMANANKRINAMGAEAHHRIMRKTTEDLAAAENMLNDAEEMAKGLGLSTWVINEHRSQLRSVRNAMLAKVSEPPPPPVPAPVDVPTKTAEEQKPNTAANVAAKRAPGRVAIDEPADKSPVDPGVELLKQAQAELRANQLDTARRMAVEVMNTSSMYKDEAQALIRTIDSEGTLQRRQAAIRAYERGVDSFQGRNYEQALAIFKLVDSSLLPPSKQRLMAEQMTVANQKLKPADLKQVSTQVPAPDAAAPERVGADSLVKQEEAMREIQFQKLRAEGLQIEASATARFGKGETDLAMQDLNAFVARVNTANIDPAKRVLLTRPIESRVERLKVLKHQQDVLTKEAKTLKDFRNQMTQEQLYKANKKEEVAKLMKDFGKLMDEGKFQEAGKVAAQARALDPEDPSTGAAMTISRMAWRREKWESIKDGKEQFNYDIGNDAQTFGPSVDIEEPYKFDQKTFNRIKNRESAVNGFGTLKSSSESQKRIEAKLTTSIVNLKFKNEPLENVIAHLQNLHGVNIYLDTRAFQQEGLDAKMPISLELNQITLQSALEILLSKANLKYVVGKEAVRITTQKGARGELVQRIIPVADLVVPVQNYTPSAVTNLEHQLLHGMQNNRPLLPGSATTPYTPMRGLGVGQGTPTGTASLTGNHQGSLVNNSTDGGTVKVESAAGTIEDSLIHLITNSIKPDTWEAMGGAGRIEYYPLGMALVINQTPDVIEEVGRLLEALRRLQDLEVAIEVRMITLAETFYERIGLDFSMNINTKNREVSTQLGNSSASNNNLTNAQNIGARVVGLAVPGVPTPDLNLPISSSSFGMAVPPFGNYPNAPGLDGGLSLGLAFLSDIQVQMFLDAAQGDRRSNVMQAPKLTMFNGQSASIQIQEQQFFLTGITVTSVNGQLVFTPQNQPFPLGVTMNMQPVVTGDRRFVRLNIQQRMTNLASATVPLFPITTIVTPVFEGGAQGQPVPFTQYVQQPTFATINVSTTVVVPDGGTVLLGGLKTLNEGRNEFGPPVLSKIPYIDRLFRNVGYGRDVQSLMMMVTPRIIINREEQERQTGVVEEAGEGQ